MRRRSPFAWNVILAVATASCSRSGRTTLLSAGATWEVIDGSWTTNGDELVGSGGHIETTAEYGDVTIEAEIEQNSSPGEGNVGMGFRCAATDYDPKKTNGYEVDWSARRRINEFVIIANVSKPLHRAWLPSPALQPLRNHVLVRARGNTFTVEVNGVAVDSFSDDAYARGHVRLWVEASRQHVRFAHVRIE